MADGVVVQDREGNFTYVNRVAADLFGRTAEDMLGRHWTEFITPETQQLVEAADARRRAGQSDRYEVQLIARDGTHLPVLVSGRPRYEQGEFAGTIAVFTDISERKRAEEAEREFLRTKEEFLLSASHSLRTPLHTLMGFLELLAGGKVQDPGQQQDFLDRAVSDARHLADLVEDVLGTAKLEAGTVQLDLQPLEPVELLAATLASLQGLARDKNIELTWSVGDVPSGMRADRTRLRQALANLVENAIHYSQSGTIVRVEAAGRDAGLEIRVMDQGPGVSPREQASMFAKPYLRPSQGEGGRGGVGLGLYLAHTIVQAHGGRLQVESEVGKGSTFTIFLPG
jgi:PAS domain S-box-containing protein